MSLKIFEAKTSTDLDRFIRLPWEIYKTYPNWVPPLVSERKNFLNPKINPFFDHAEVKFFLVEDPKNNTVGRIALVHDHIYQERYYKNTGIIGMFESIDDKNVSQMLFDEAKTWCHKNRFDKLIGPMNLSINHECGLMVEGFDLPPMLGISYNPNYYEKHFLEWGFDKSKDLISLKLDLTGIPKYLQDAAKKLEKRGRFSVRPLNMTRFEDDLKAIWDIYNSAWDMNWGSVPMTHKEFSYAAREMKSFVDPEFCLIAEVKGEPVGFGLALPDINQVLIELDGKLFPFGWAKFLWKKNKIDTYRVLTLGIKKKYRKLGIDAYMYYDMYKNFIEKGIKWCETSWMLEDNIDILEPIFKLGATIYKKHRIYERNLSY